MSQDTTRPLDPRQTYLLLPASGEAEAVEGGMAFWSQPETVLERFGQGWLVAEFESAADWPNWERHPEADELVYVLEGAAEFLLEHAAGVERVLVRAPGLLVVPRGVWHTARVDLPTRMLHVTRGAGTEHRPVGPEGAGG